MKIIHELINLGKGIYGNGYTQIDVEDLLKIYDEREASGGGTTGSTVTVNGHVILDGNGSQMTQQPNLRFNRMIVTNDNVNDQTIVTRPPSVTISTTPPLNPLVGDEWINSTTWKTYVYYDNYWVEESRIGSGDQNFKPVLNSYLNEAAMIADQGTQISGYIYYDIGNNLYYEKLSTYNGLITDYRIIGGSGLISPGAGLSIDNNDRIQLAKLYDDGSDKYYYVDLFEFPKNIGDSLYFNITSNFQNYFNGVGNFNGLEIIDDNVSRLRSRNRTSNTTSATVAVNTNINTASSTISAGNSTLGRTSVISNNVDSNGVFLELIKNIEILSINKSQSLKFDNDLNNNKIILLDDINEKGIEYVGDYEPNFTARSLVTKQYVDSISGTTITGTKTEGYIATIVSGTPTWSALNSLVQGTNNLNQTLVFKSNLSLGSSGTAFKFDTLDNFTIIEILGNTSPGWPYYNRPQVNFRNSQVKIFSVGNNWQDRPFEIINSNNTSILSVSGDGSLSISGGFSPANLGSTNTAIFTTLFQGWGAREFGLFYGSQGGGGYNYFGKYTIESINGALTIRSANLKSPDNSTSHAVKVLSDANTLFFEVLGNGRISIPNLTTTDPNVSGVLWNDNGILKLSSGGVGPITYSGHLIKSNGTPLTQRTGLNFSTSFIVTDDSVNNETDITINTNVIATKSYVDGNTAQYNVASRLYLFNNY